MVYGERPVSAESDPEAWLGMYLRRLAHDLIGPARNALGFTQLLQRRLADHPDEKVAHYLEHLEAESQRQHAMLEGAQLYGRLSTVDFTRQELRLAELVDAAWRQLQERYPAATLDNRIAVDTVLYADKQHADLLLFQLLDNAAKFQKNGNDAHIIVSSSQSDDCMQIVISDNGIGIMPNHYHDVVLLYKQLHPREEYHGYGLGLTYANAIMRRYSGSINFTSANHGGLQITLNFPRP